MYPRCLDPRGTPCLDDYEKPGDNCRLDGFLAAYRHDFSHDTSSHHDVYNMDY